MGKITRSMFKAYCPEKFRRLKDIASGTKSCTVTLGKNHIIVVAEDLHNMDGSLTFKCGYEPNVEEKLRGKLEEIEGILRGIYSPLYHAFDSTIRTQLKGVSMTFNDYTGVTLHFADDTTESFGFRSDEYERFVARISDLLLPVVNVLQNENRCKSGEHCQNCHDTHCSHSPNYAQTLWEEMDSAMQQSFLEKLDPEKRAEFLQLVKRRDNNERSEKG